MAQPLRTWYLNNCHLRICCILKYDSEKKKWSKFYLLRLEKIYQISLDRHLAAKEKRFK